MIVVFSTSLNPRSRSRILARTAINALQELGESAELIDLSEVRLPFCDAGQCYSDPNVKFCGDAIRRSKAVLVATPVYNYDVCAVAKNLVELTGDAWKEKVVGFMASAGGTGSFMALMGLANSLMLDFRSFIVPRFVYATEDKVSVDGSVDPAVQRRTIELVMQTAWIANAFAAH